MPRIVKMPVWNMWSYCTVCGSPHSISQRDDESKKSVVVWTLPVRLPRFLQRICKSLLQHWGMTYNLSGIGLDLLSRLIPLWLLHSVRQRT